MSNNGDPTRPQPGPDQAPPPPAGYPGAPTPPGPSAPPPGAAPQPPYTVAPGYPGASAPPPQGAYPQGAYPGPAGMAPPPRQPMSPRGKKLLLWGLIGGGLLIVLIIAGLVVAGVLRQQAAEQAAKDEAAAISGAVTGYLQALVDGDAEAAVSHLIDPEESPLLTDEVLAASNETAAITDIDVAEVDPEELEGHYGDWEIAASYAIGDERVEASFTVSDSTRDEGDYGILNGLTSVYVPERYAPLGATVNGAAIEGEQAAAFPGAYRLDIGDDRFTLGGTTSGIAARPLEPLNLGDGELALTDGAVSSLRSKVIDAVHTCIASTKLKAGCGLTMESKINDGDVTLRDGTLKRSLPSSTKTTLRSLGFTVSYDDPLVVTSDFIGSIDLEADGRSASGVSGRYELYFGGPMLESATIDLSGDEPKVSWD